MMTPPDFHFNEKTGEIRRGGIVIPPLCRLHRDMLACLLLASEQSPVGAPAIARASGMRTTNVPDEIRNLARRLSHVAIRIATSPQGRWLIFEEMRKWKPNIPPPVRLEGEAR